MEKAELKYPHPNGEITVLWRPHLCKHAGICVEMLSQVYKPKEKPWITAENAGTAELIHQIDQCPSGALGYELKEDSKNEILSNPEK